MLGDSPMCSLYQQPVTQEVQPTGFNWSMFSLHFLFIVAASVLYSRSRRLQRSGQILVDCFAPVVEAYLCSDSPHVCVGFNQAGPDDVDYVVWERCRSRVRCTNGLCHLHEHQINVDQLVGKNDVGYVAPLPQLRVRQQYSLKSLFRLQEYVAHVYDCWQLAELVEVLRCRSDAVLVAYKAAAWAHRVASCAVDCCGSVCYHTAMLKELWAENYWPSPVRSREADFDTDCSAASVLPVGNVLSEAAPAVAPTQCADVVESVADNLALIDSGATQPVCA